MIFSNCLKSNEHAVSSSYLFLVSDIIRVLILFVLIHVDFKFTYPCLKTLKIFSVLFLDVISLHNV